MNSNTVLLVVRILIVLYLGFRIARLENVVVALARMVEKPWRREWAIREEVKQLEEQLDNMREDFKITGGDPDHWDEADRIRERIDRRLRALARGKPRETPPAQ